MKLVVNELYSSIFQEITSVDDVQIGAIRPHIYKHNAPNGKLQLQVQDLSGNTLATSTNEISASDITAISFFHGKIKFVISYKMKANTTYRIALVGVDGYTFDESAWFGWCAENDISVYESEYTAGSGFNSPLLMEIWKLKRN